MVLQHVTSKAEIDKICASTSNIVVVDFYADWCGPCKQIAPLYEQLSNKYGSKAVFLKVDADKMPNQDKGTYEVKALPTFKIFHKLQTLDTIVGADINKLEAAVAQHSAKYGAFAGGSQGYTLTGGRASASAAHTSRGSASSAATTSASASAAPKRRNPWADPNWVPPGMRKTDAAPAAGGASAASNTTKAPVAATAVAPRQPSAATAARNASALQRPAEANQVARGASSISQADPALLSVLVSMGFDQAHASKALVATKNRNADEAVTWMLDHPEPAPAPAPTRAPAAAAAPGATLASASPADKVDDVSDMNTDDQDSAALSKDDQKVLDVAAAAAAALGGAVVDTTGDADMTGPSIVDSVAEMDDSMREIVEAKRREAQQLQKKALKGEKMPEILTRKVSELTSEEKQEWLAAKRDFVRKQKATEALENQKAKEKSRRDTGKAALELQRQRDEFQRQQLIEKRKREERDKKKQKAELKEKLRAEKEARARAREQERQEVERIRAAKAAAAAAGK